jgi:hypothetical protein
MRIKPFLSGKIVLARLGLLGIFLLFCWIISACPHRGSTWRKMDSVRESQQALAKAIEAYHAAHRVYPPMRLMHGFTTGTLQASIGFFKDYNGEGLYHGSRATRPRGLPG